MAAFSVNLGAPSQMIRRYIPLVAVLLLVLACLLAWTRGTIAKGPTLQAASELLAVQQKMTARGVYGFLPGTHSVLSDRLRAKRFTHVSIMPIMVQGGHAANIAGLNIGTSIDLMRSDADTNRWVVSRTVRFGRKSWSTQIGELRTR